MSVLADMSEIGDLADTLAAAGAKAAVVSTAHMTMIAARLASDARAAAPVASGELRNSITTGGGKGYRVVKANARHSFFVEFGTSDTAPQPFMWPQAPKASQRLEKALAGIDPFD